MGWFLRPNQGINYLYTPINENVMKIKLVLSTLVIGLMTVSTFAQKAEIFKEGKIFWIKN